MQDTVKRSSLYSGAERKPKGVELDEEDQHRRQEEEAARQAALKQQQREDDNRPLSVLSANRFLPQDEKYQERIQLAHDGALGMQDTFLEAMPVVGGMKNLADAYAGENLITGEKLSIWGRGSKFLAGITGTVPMGSTASNAVSSGSKVVRAGKTGAEIAEKSLDVASIVKNGNKLNKVTDGIKATTQGPAKVNSSWFRNAWDRIFGKKPNSTVDFTEQLGVSHNRARAKLRSALGSSAPHQAHHIIPWETRSHDLVQRAARGGFNINGAENGISLARTQHLGSHPRYNAAVKRKLDELLSNNPGLSDSQYADLLRGYVEQLRNGLTTSNSMLH
ncbi:AHH domain-containing protein [Pirellulaceae bacterium SH449]